MTRMSRARLSIAPAEGWISLALVAAMALSVAWSLDDAALVLGRGEWTDFLAWAALGGVAAGFLGARAGWNRPLAHLIGACFAAVIVPLMVGSVLDITRTPAGRYEAAAASMVNAALDFAVDNLPVTRQTGHYLLVLGGLCWANGQFAASAVFRHGRPIGPIMVLGAILVANMSATLHDQIWLLVLFSLASLFLLTRLHALEEQATWIRRRIGDPTTVGSLYLRGGTLFIVTAVFAALTLTASARSAPLAGFWDDAKPLLISVSQWLQRIIPETPDTRGLGIPTFGAQVSISGLWQTGNDPTLLITRLPGDDRAIYWRATTYDRFTLNGWITTTTQPVPRASGTAILDGTQDAIVDPTARVPETFQVAPQSRVPNPVFTPLDPISVNQDVTLNLAGTNGSLQSISIDGHDPYSVTAALPALIDEQGGVTQNRLRAAGTSYPDAIKAMYTPVPDGAMGPAATKLLSDLMARLQAAGTTTPFDIATAIVNEFHNPDRYVYSTNVLRVCDRFTSIVECFADQKTGYCEHYASAMAILLRKEGIPARLVEGYLPGDLDKTTGKELIRASGGHAWVEVYFPGFGWYLFDPTGGGRSQATELPVGKFIPIASPTPRPSSSGGAPRGNLPGGERSAPVVTGGGNTTRIDPGKAGLIVAALLLLVAILIVAFLAYRRGPRSASTPDGVYASVVGLARRLGFGPRPTQTAFEYAAVLGDILPAVRPELHTVATAKVEVTYGNRVLDPARLQGLRESYRRLRVGLLRLVFRRRDRKRMR